MRTPLVPGGLGFSLGFGAGIVVTLISVATGATRQPVWSVVALAVTVAAVSAVATPLAALGTVAVCWCLHAGFVLGRAGVLVFTPASAWSAVALLATAAGVSLTSTLVEGAGSASMPERRASRTAAGQGCAGRRS